MWCFDWQVVFVFSTSYYMSISVYQLFYLSPYLPTMMQGDQRSKGLLEELLTLLGIVFCERHVAGVGQVDENAELRRAVIHALVPGPVSRSELVKKLRSIVDEASDIDAVLQQVATPRLSYIG